MNKTIVRITCILVSILLFVCSISAREVNLSGTWEGAFFDHKLKQKAKVTVELIQSDTYYTGYITTSDPFSCRGQLMAWTDEKGRLNAKVKCVEHGGHTIHLEGGIVEAKYDSKSNQTIGKIKGAFRLKTLMSKYDGEFVIAKGMQIIDNEEGYTNISLYPVFVNCDSNIYHIANCHKLGTDIMKFSSSVQARESGGGPCKDCNP